MSIHKFKINLFNYDSWDEDSLANYKRTENAWKQAAVLLSNFSYSTSHGLLDIHVNWAPAIESLSPLYCTKAKIQATVKLHNKIRKDAARNTARHYLEVFLYDFFLIVNLAVPGTCNFFNTEIFPLTKASDTINQDSYQIERAVIFSAELGWPSIKDLEMTLVYNWLQSLRIGPKQVAQSRIEKIIFALLNALHGNTDITNILWLSLALEAFYDTPAVEIVRHLRARVFKWLAVPENNKKAIKKEFDNFYTLRSTYVHGDFEIMHPLCNEVIDKNVDSQLAKLYHANSFGLAVLIASIQSLIENNYSEINFDEIINGKQI